MTNREDHDGDDGEDNGRRSIGEDDGYHGGEEGLTMFVGLCASLVSSWPDGPFPKRLGVELSGRDIPQAARRLMSPMGTNLQATSTGQTHQFLHKQSTRLADHLRQPSTAPVSYPMNSQEPFAHGLSQNAVIQLLRILDRTSTNVGSHTQPPVGPVAGSVHPSRPGAPNIRPRGPPATAPGVFYITRKGQLHIEALLLSYALYLPTVRYLDATRVGGGPSRGCSYPLKKTLGDLASKIRKFSVPTAILHRLRSFRCWQYISDQCLGEPSTCKIRRMISMAFLRYWRKLVDLYTVMQL
ncbi:hypothetical protein Tco_1417965 [Tanacetum coccineum]